MNGSPDDELLPPLARRLDGKVALITGGASGFGESTARLFARHGARVVIADIQDDKGLSLCRELSGRASYVHCDVTNESDVRTAVDLAVSAHGALDVMFNNAGIPGKLDFAISEADGENFRRVMEANAYGAFLGTKHAARVMVPARKGVVLYTSSVASVTAGESPHAYEASKHAVVGLMRSACVELGRYGVRANCISPCAVATPLLTGAMGVGSGVVDGIIGASATLKGVVPTAEDVAEAALYLAGDGARFVSGVNLVVDGGYSITNGSYSRAIESVFGSPPSS
ncbi:NAD(P)-binding Rossmann-fold superfamily protein [Striga asiatica]|uniref:NAD(P)-binding Rossmann-fold superfamily protein n=1 Tax=Striga asiatica TaxID=4170 RepID=A0A5A7P983_STRAF|nr:NAD(P)-binding Rossmann-fold superfamily protein [Striga asiatica]